MRSNTAATNAGWSVRCAACGSCCNSAPVLSLPELFRHQRVFIGTLGLRRVRRVRARDSLGRGSAALEASEEDRAACARIAADCLHPMSTNDTSGYDLLFAPLGFDDPSLGRCPALGQDSRCTIHGRDKPAMCRAVPFDPLMPDRLQHLVLAERWAESDELGARCIARTTDPQRMSVQGVRVLDGDARRALSAGRRALAADKRFWGNALFTQIAEQFLTEPESAERIPTQGFLVIPLAPVLELLAGFSDRCRERCLDYLDAQIVLCETAARACQARNQSLPGESLGRLRGFLRANQTLRGVLVSRRPQRAAGQGAAPADVEAWLAHAQPELSALLGGGPVP